MFSEIDKSIHLSELMQLFTLSYQHDLIMNTSGMLVTNEYDTILILKIQPFLYRGFGCYHICAMLEILRPFWPPKWTWYIAYSLFQSTDWLPGGELWRDLWHSLCLTNDISYWQMASSPRVLTACYASYVDMSYILNKYTHFTPSFDTIWMDLIVDAWFLTRPIIS